MFPIFSDNWDKPSNSNVQPAPSWWLARRMLYPGYARPPFYISASALHWQWCLTFAFSDVPFPETGTWPCDLDRSTFCTSTLFSYIFSGTQSSLFVFFCTSQLCPSTTTLIMESLGRAPLAAILMAVRRILDRVGQYCLHSPCRTTSTDNSPRFVI